MSLNALKNKVRAKYSLSFDTGADLEKSNIQKRRLNTYG